MNNRYYCRIVLVCAALFVSAGSAPAARPQDTPVVPDCFSTRWPHELSELAPDPSLVFGKFANGFRYVLKHNSEPRNRVGIFLDVQAGSANETDTERGLAHYLEHMMFNGSTNFKPGELVGYFQSIGMSFGGDANAHTTYDETVYKIILPEGTEQAMDDGLLVMRDFARGASLTPAEIDRERGVILAEKTARDSASYRAHVAGSAFSLKGSILPDRMPIGSLAVLGSAGENELRSFYDAWYRPDNMILVMVGDFDRQAVEPLIAKHFSGLRGVGAPPRCPGYGEVQHQGTQAFYHYEPELGSTEVSLETIWNKKPENDSFSLEVEGVYRYLAVMIINNRLARLAEKPDSPFSSASYYAGTTLDRYRYAGISAKTGEQDWQEALGRLDIVLRQALRFGFTRQEVERVKKELLGELEDAVETQATRNSLMLANRIIHHVNANRVMQSPAQELELFGPVIAGVSAEQLHETLRGDWNRDVRLVEVIGDAELAEEGAAAIIGSLYADLSRREVEEPAGRSEIAFPYLEPTPEVAGPIRTERFDAIGVERFVYENGVVLNIKKTDFKQKSVRLALHFGSGRENVALQGLPLLAESIVNGSGTGSLKRTELDTVLAGSSVEYGFRVGQESFVWEGSAVDADTELLFQVLQTVMRDPGMRPEIHALAMKNFSRMYQQLDSDVQGAMELEIEPFLAGDHASFGLPDWQAFKDLTLDQVRGWLMPDFAGAPLEISVVGDIDGQLIKELTTRYFGGLPARQGQRRTDPAAPEFPSGQELAVTVPSSVDKAIVHVAWPTDDFWDIGRTRRLHVLAALMNDRLRQEIREKLGASYAPAVYSAPSRSYPGYGVLAAHLVVEDEAIDLARREVLKVAASMVDRPVSGDELERAAEPILTSIRDAVRTNDYWLSTVLALSTRHPQQLAWPLTILEDFARITADDITVLAGRYLAPENRAAVGIIRSAAP